MENEAMIENEKLEGSEKRDIPYIAYESSLMRSDRANPTPSMDKWVDKFENDCTQMYP